MDDNPLSRWGLPPPKKANDPLRLGSKKIARTILAVATIGLLTYTTFQERFNSAPGQQTMRSYIEVRKDGGKFDVIPCVTVVFLTSGTSYSRPGDWNAAANSIECIGAGGNGGVEGSHFCPSACGCVPDGGAGGNGGAYAKSVNLNIGATATYGIGAAGGGDTFFNATSAANAASLGNTVACAAKGATASTTGSTGSTLRAGGGGGAGQSGGAGHAGGGGGAGGTTAGGSAGAAGFLTEGAGGAGGTTSGGSGGGIPGGAGGAGTVWTATAGGTAGAGGGGGGNSAGTGGLGGLYGGGGGGGGPTGGSGRQGIIAVTYTPLVGGKSQFIIFG